MMKLSRLSFYLLPFSLAFFTACSGNLAQTLLFEDDFAHLPVGIISADEGSFLEYHYVPGAGQIGPWSISSFGKEEAFHSAWEIREGENGNYLRQNLHLIDEDYNRKRPLIHPIIIGGDSIWHNYKIDFKFSPEALMDQCGVLFKYQNDRCYYFYGMEGNKLIIKMVQHETAPHRTFEKVLAAVDYDWKVGEVYKGDISIKENKIYTMLNDSLILIVEDDTYTNGKIGLLSDVPASFFNLDVRTLNSEKRKMNRLKHQLATDKAMRISENPMPVLWKQISTLGFGTGSNLRFGDLGGDGELDVLIGQVVNDASLDGVSQLSCLTAITTNGDVLWQIGKADPKNYVLKGEVAFQVHDLDGDGDKEVIYVMNSYITVVNGKTGKQIRRKKLAQTSRVTEAGFSSIGESLSFCDLQGKGRDSDLLYKDKYMNLWAFDEHLRTIWHQKAKTGHIPYASDIDGDGKDEIAFGFNLYASDGELIWSKEGDLGAYSHGTAMLPLRMPKDSVFNIVSAAGDWGIYLFGMHGEIKKHHPLGHIQNISIANFRSDLPGLEIVSMNYWGSQGLIHYYDARGNLIHSIEPGPYGSMCLPVNWKGDGVEYFLLNTSPGDGGLFDGYGHIAVAFPDDAHPDMSNAVLDLTGDARDEIVTWNQNELWIYTQQDNPRRGNTFQPKRNQLYNYSNYQVSVSESYTID